MSRVFRKHDPTKGFVRLALVRPYCDYARRLGIPIKPVLKRFGLTPTSLDNPDKFVHVNIIYGLINNLADTAKDPHFGFHVIEQMAFEDWPPFTIAASEAGTFGEFLTLIIAHLRFQANSIHWFLKVDGDNALFYAERLSSARESAQHSEGSGVAPFGRLFEIALGRKWNPEQATIKTRYLDAIPDRPFGMNIERKEVGDFEIIFPAAWLFQPISFKKPGQAAEAFAKKMTSNASLLSAIREAARPMLHSMDVRLEDIAAVLGLSAPQLQKGLEVTGTSLNQELRQLRIEEAQSALEIGWKVSQVSERLGYSDPTHFARFFRSQAGLSPRDYQKQYLR